MKWVCDGCGKTVPTNDKPPIPCVDCGTDSWRRELDV